MKSDSDTNSTLVLRDDLLAWLAEFIRSNGRSLMFRDKKLSQLLDVLDERLHMHLGVRSNSTSLDECMRNRVHCRFFIDTREKWLQSVAQLESEVIAGDINLGKKNELSVHPLAAAAMEDAAETGIDLFISDIPEDHPALPIPETDPPQEHQPERFEYPDWFVAESEDDPDELFEQLFSDALSSLRRRFRRDFDPLTGSEAAQSAMTKILSGSPPHQLKKYVRRAARNAFVRHKRRERALRQETIRATDPKESHHTDRDRPRSATTNCETLWAQFKELLAQFDEIQAAMIVATMIDKFPPRECCQKVYYQSGTLPAGQSRPSDQRRTVLQRFYELRHTHVTEKNIDEPDLQ